MQNHGTLIATLAASIFAAVTGIITYFLRRRSGLKSKAKIISPCTCLVVIFFSYSSLSDHP